MLYPVLCSRFAKIPIKKVPNRIHCHMKAETEENPLNYGKEIAQDKEYCQYLKGMQKMNPLLGLNIV